jgi:cis-3-alkyl-4-acyloxetan-2-one decarboxylase
MNGEDRESIIHYIDEGKGEPVVFLHGNPTWSFYFRKIIKPLRKQYRCIALDHLGCGLSEKNPSHQYSLNERSLLLERFLDSLDIKKCHLIVHDWGGAIGMAFAVRNPERVASVVITNTAAFPSEWISWRINLCRFPFIGRLINYYLNGFLKAAMHMATIHPLKKEVKTGYLLPYKRLRDRESIDQFVKDIPMDETHLSYPVLRNIAENLNLFKDQQMLILWGMKDFCFSPYFLNKWKAYYPNAKTVEFEDAGHFLFEEKAKECLMEISEFLAHNPLRDQV